MSSTKIFHIPRDYTKSLKDQKEELRKQYNDFYYLDTDGAFGKEPKIHFMSTGKKRECNEEAN